VFCTCLNRLRGFVCSPNLATCSTQSDQTSLHDVIFDDNSLPFEQNSQVHTGSFLNCRRTSVGGRGRCRSVPVSNMVACPLFVPVPIAIQPYFRYEECALLLNETTKIALYRVFAGFCLRLLFTPHKCSRSYPSTTTAPNIPTD
jgi:hypothetical protein